jgi:hypothetical protein
MPRLLVVLVGLSCAAASALEAQSVDTLRMTVRWEVTEGMHDSADSLGTLSGIAMDARGVVYVSDASDGRIWVFDSLGRSQRAIGRKGNGPGEFQAPTGIAIGPDGQLYVRDLELVTRFGVDPATRRLTKFVDAFRGPPMSDWMSRHPTRFDREGHVYYPAFNMMMRELRSGVFYQYRPDGTLGDSVVVPPFPGAPASTASVRISAREGRMLRGLNHPPFSPLPHWDITPRGTLLTSDGRSYLIRETDRNGRVITEYRRAVAAERIPAAERRDSLEALRQRRDSVTVPRSQVLGVPPEVWALQLPETYPAILGVYAGEDGRVWVRRWVAGGSARTVFDVFESDGRFSRVVVLDRAISSVVTPSLSLGGIAAVAVDPETGAHGVLTFRPARR